ncbi:VWA domain-containing protein [Arenicella sp. 4NH20-0111]|uniref:VWA domain-containing protein n=1 Tax=Arenicella sp. 4NH20-0111 TaxID=3127648 RepID=UPI00310C64C7
MLANFHFLRPEWFLLLPVVLLVWFFGIHRISHTLWADHLPQAALKALRVNHDSRRSQLRWWLLLIWLLLIVGAAGPSWIKETIPSLSNENATVLVLDLSPSMLSEDIKPNRITIARFELLDLLDTVKDGQVGLIVYAGTAHTVSPLTDDPRTIAALVPALSPEYMPEAGSNLEDAIQQAEKLFDDAGFPAGQIILITDGVSDAAANTVAQRLTSSRSLSILGIGANDQAPIPTKNGGFLRDQRGNIITTSLDTQSLQAFSSKTRGNFVVQRPDNVDSQRILRLTNLNQGRKNDKQNSVEYDAWQDMAYLLVLLSLPLMLLLFRKGIIYGILFFTIIPLPTEASDDAQKWSNYLYNKDQRATKLLDNGDSASAAALFSDDKWAAIAHFRNGDYQQVVSTLAPYEDVQSLYNKANAQALNGDLEDALQTYNRVINLSPDNEDAIHNRRVVEELLKQRESEPESAPNDDQQSESSDDNNQTENTQDKKSQSSDSNQQQEAEEQKSKDDSSGQQNGSNSSTQSNEKPSQNDKMNDPTSSDDASQQSSETETQEQDVSQNKPDNERASADQKELNESPNSESKAESNEDTDTEPKTATLSTNSEQWLRSIEDDPAGLLRRKFQFQAQQIERERRSSTDTKSGSNEERY